MLAYIKGALVAAWENECIVLTDAGVGYEISLPANARASLPPAGEKVEFYLSLVSREDAQELYGFPTLEEKRTFEILRSISRVGARTALAMLSVFSPEDLYNIVQEEDYRKIAIVPGVGMKTAQHVFLELKYKLKRRNVASGAVRPNSSPAPSVFADVLGALTNLGYGEEECAPKIREILEAEPDLDASSAIRQTLKALAKGKK